MMRFFFSPFLYPLLELRHGSMLTVEPGQHNHNNPLDSDGHRSRSPPIDERDREMLGPPLNMNSSGLHSPNSPEGYERRHNSINGAYQTSSPRVQSPEGEEEQTARPRSSEFRTDDIPSGLRATSAVPKGTNTTRVGVHEMPVPSPNLRTVSPYKPPGGIDTRLEGH
jgi:hypothetical protein